MAPKVHAADLSKRAAAALHQKDYAEAERLYDELSFAMIYENAHPVDIAAALHTLAQIQEAQGKESQSESTRKRALKVLRSSQD